MSQRPRGARLARRTSPPPPPGINAWGLASAALGVLALVLTCTAVVLLQPFLVTTIALGAVGLALLGLRSAARQGRSRLWAVVGLASAVVPLLLSLLWLFVLSSDQGL